MIPEYFASVFISSQQQITVTSHEVTAGRKDQPTGVSEVGIKPPSPKPAPSPQGKGLLQFSVLHSCIQWKLPSYEKVF